MLSRKASGQGLGSGAAAVGEGNPAHPPNARTNTRLTTSSHRIRLMAVVSAPTATTWAALGSFTFISLHMLQQSKMADVAMAILCESIGGSIRFSGSATGIGPWASIMITAQEDARNIAHARRVPVLLLSYSAHNEP